MYKVIILQQTMSKYLINPALPLLPVAAYKGVPLDKNNRFENLEFPFTPSFQDVWKWKSKPNPFAEEKKKDSWRMPVMQDDSFLTSGKDCIVWLGHASYFIRINGKQLLIDPVFGKLSPLMTRFTACPIAPEKFVNIDYILVSHDHRDHCDSSSLRLLAKQNPHAQYFTSLRLDTLLRSWTNAKSIQAAGWYQSYKMEEDAGIELFFLPTRHWCRRYISDTNWHLWGAFMIRANGKTIYFGGDTGFAGHFEEVKRLFGAPDYYLVGVGAYQPEWFMAPSHMSPKSAVEAAKILAAKHILPMHYGTFDLSDESLGNPRRVLEELKQGDVFLRERLHCVNVGEIVEIL